MAMDSKQKRMSAMNVSCPWRGPLVDAPETGTTVGNRQAAAFLYSGIGAADAVPGPFYIEAAELFAAGAVKGGLYDPNGLTEEAAEIFVIGAVAGEVR